MDEIVAFCPACNAPVYAPQHLPPASDPGCPAAESLVRFGCACRALLLRKLELENEALEIANAAARALAALGLPLAPGAPTRWR